MTLNADLVRSNELATRLKAVAGFRNLLVHMYQKVEPAAVHDILSNSLPDLRAFAAAVVQLV